MDVPEFHNLILIGLSHERNPVSSIQISPVAFCSHGKRDCRGARNPDYLGLPFHE